MNVLQSPPQIVEIYEIFPEKQDTVEIKGELEDLIPVKKDLPAEVKDLRFKIIIRDDVIGQGGYGTINPCELELSKSNKIIESNK
jgi:hypothetical protein